MRILALIPARGGSKRLPGKNIRPLGGKPLIVWSIETARELSGCYPVMVSTDDPEIASIARAAGAMVPWLRPAELAGDTSGSVDVALHALDWYEERNGQVDGLLLLQPTSPFRSRDSMEKGLRLFEQGAGAAVIGVVPAATHPMWAFQVAGGRLKPYLAENGLKVRSQDLPEAFSISGSFYLIDPSVLRTERTFFAGDPLPLFLEARESIDIDTLDDFRLAEAMLAINGIGPA